jgi:hypothetical protein
MDHEMHRVFWCWDSGFILKLPSWFYLLCKGTPLVLKHNCLMIMLFESTKYVLSTSDANMMARVYGKCTSFCMTEFT